MLAFLDEEDGPKSFAKQRTRNKRRLMSDRLLSGRGQYLSKTAKVGYKQFYMCGFEGIGERRTPVGRDADGSSFQLLDLGS